MGLAYKLGVYLTKPECHRSVCSERGHSSARSVAGCLSDTSLGPKGRFSIQPDFDDIYALTSLEFCRELLQLPASVSALEVKVTQGASGCGQEGIMELMGPQFRVRDRDDNEPLSSRSFERRVDDLSHSQFDWP